MIEKINNALKLPVYSDKSLVILNFIKWRASVDPTKKFIVNESFERAFCPDFYKLTNGQICAYFTNSFRGEFFTMHEFLHWVKLVTQEIFSKDSDIKDKIFSKKSVLNFLKYTYPDKFDPKFEEITFEEIECLKLILEPEQNRELLSHFDKGLVDALVGSVDDPLKEQLNSALRKTLLDEFEKFSYTYSVNYFDDAFKEMEIDSHLVKLTRENYNDFQKCDDRQIDENLLAKINDFLDKKEDYSKFCKALKKMVKRRQELKKQLKIFIKKLNKEVQN